MATKQLVEGPKESGMDVVLRGRRFRKEVADYAAARGVTEENAEKAVFVKRMQDLRLEITHEGFFSQRLENAPRFEGAFKEVFDKKQREQIMHDAADGTVFRPLHLTELTPKEYQTMRKRMPGAPHSVVQDAAENARLIPALLQRFSEDTRLASTGDIHAILATHRDLSADLGRAVLAIDTVMRHEMGRDANLAFERTIKEAIETTANAITDMFWRAPLEWWKAVSGSSSASKLEMTGNVVIETANLLAREVGAVLRITGASLKGLMMYAVRGILGGETERGKKEKKEK